MHGTATSVAEVTHISTHGFWLLLKNEELLVPFAEFPWFKQATIGLKKTVKNGPLRSICSRRFPSPTGSYTQS